MSRRWLNLISIGARHKRATSSPHPPVDPFPPPSMFFTLPYPLRSVLGLIQGIRFSVLEIPWVFGLVIALAVILILLYHSTCKSRLKSDHDWLVDLQKHTIPALNYGKPESEQVTLGLEIAM